MYVMQAEMFGGARALIGGKGFSTDATVSALFVCAVPFYDTILDGVRLGVV